MLNLILTAEEKFVCVWPGLGSFQWDALAVNRDRVNVQVYSSCCNKSVQTSLRLLHEPPKKTVYLCSNCLQHSGIPINELTMINSGYSWEWENPVTVETCVTEVLPVLEAEIFLSYFTDVMVHIMNSASALYACLPEGNLRGPTPLTNKQKKDINLEVIEKIALKGLTP